MDRKIDVKIAAQLAEMPVDEFLYLNPQHNRPVIAGADEYAILLPIDKAELFAAKLELADQPLVSWQAYRMRNGETLAAGRREIRAREEALRAVNGIGAKAKVPAGHTLLVPTQGPTEAAAGTLSQAVFTTVPQGRTFYYRVKRGETLAGIAARYAVSPADLKRWNGLAKNSRRGRANVAHHERSRAVRRQGQARGGTRVRNERGGRKAPAQARRRSRLR